MQITLDLPDEIAGDTGAGQLKHDILQSFAVEKYRVGKISKRQLSDLLKLDYWQTQDLLARLDAIRPYTLADLEVDRKSLATLDQK